MEIGDAHVKVKRASIGAQQVAAIDMNVNAVAMLAGTVSGDASKGRVLQLMNMVTLDDLINDLDYNGKFHRNVSSHNNH